MNDWSVDLEIHPTKDTSDNHVNGTLTVLWRDWDKHIEKDPKMVYVSSVNPGQIKGPHLHLKRSSYFTCIHGKVLFVIRDQHGNYHEIESNETKPTMVRVPKNFASAHINLSNDISRIITLADVSWKPNDNEMVNVTFDDYDWDKWRTIK